MQSIPVAWGGVLPDPRVGSNCLPWTWGQLMCLDSCWEILSEFMLNLALASRGKTFISSLESAGINRIWKNLGCFLAAGQRVAEVCRKTAEQKGSRWGPCLLFRMCLWGQDHGGMEQGCVWEPVHPGTGLSCVSLRIIRPRDNWSVLVYFYSREPGV